MDPQIEKIATAHESFSDLLHGIDPAQLIAIARAAAGVQSREHVTIRYRNPRVQVRGWFKRARDGVVDVVYTVLDASRKIVEVWIFEIELSFSRRKIRLWAHYEITMETECDADARVIVFSPKTALRERIRTKLLPRIKTKPILIEPDQIERISDYADARARPELTILGALFHAQPPAPFEAQVEVMRAAWMALQSLAESVALRYSVAVMSIIAQNVIDRAVADLRETGELDEDRWELVSESERDGHSFCRGHGEGLEQGREEGREQGREEGRAETLQRTIVDILELRGFALTPAHHQHIGACASVATLERWYAAAKAAAANQPVDSILGEF